MLIIIFYAHRFIFRILCERFTNTSLYRVIQKNIHQKRLTLIWQLGVFLPRRTFYHVALKPLKIVTKAFVTFPEYMLAKNAEKNFRYLHQYFQYGGWKMDTQLKRWKILF